MLGEDVVLVRMDIRDCLVAAASVICILTGNAVGLTISTIRLQVVIVLFASSD